MHDERERQRAADYSAAHALEGVKKSFFSYKYCNIVFFMI
jgi:hypothetical protein